MGREERDRQNHREEPLTKQDRAAAANQQTEVRREREKDLALQLGHMVIAAGRIDSRLWDACVALGHHLDHDFPRRAGPAGHVFVPSMEELSALFRRRLPRGTGKNKTSFPLRYQRHRATAVLTALAHIDYPAEATQQWRDWFAHAGQAQEVRNRCVHDPWNWFRGDEDDESVFLTFEDGGTDPFDFQEVDGVRDLVERLEQLQTTLSRLHDDLHAWLRRASLNLRDDLTRPFELSATNR